MPNGGKTLKLKLGGRGSRKAAKEKYNKGRRNGPAKPSSHAAQKPVVPNSPVPAVPAKLFFKHRSLPRPVRILKSTFPTTPAASGVSLVPIPPVAMDKTSPNYTFFARQKGIIWTKICHPVTVPSSCSLERLLLALRERFYLQSEMAIRSITVIVGPIASYLNMRDIPIAQKQWEKIKELIVKDGKSGGHVVFEMEPWTGNTV